MSEIAEHTEETRKTVSLVSIGGMSALIQLVVIITGVIVAALLGARPDSVQEYYSMMNQSRFLGLLRDEFPTTVLVALYLFTFPGLFYMTMQKKFTLSFIAILLTVAGVILCLSSYTGFSMMYLSDRYLAAGDPGVRSQLIAAGESVIACNMWNSGAGFFSGLFLQGGGLLFCAAMLGSGEFGRVTIYSGFVANGLDLFQHLIHNFAPSPAAVILMLGGPFYLVWFFMLWREMSKYARRNQ